MDDVVREQLAAADPVFRRLMEEHSERCRQLETLTTKPFLSSEEQIEENRLKKLKLRLKDEMEARMHSPVSAMQM